MKKYLVFLLCLAISGCNGFSPPPPTSTATITPTMTPTLTPINIPTITKTPRKSPDLIKTLGERILGYPALPVFSSDGKMIALASERIRIWDVNSSQLLQEFTNPYPKRCYVENISFSSDNSMLAVSIYCGEDPFGHLMIWNVADGKLLHEWEQRYASIHTEYDLITVAVLGFAFLPGSSMIAYSNGNTVEIRNVRESTDPTTLTLGPEMLASKISVSGDGNLLFVLMELYNPFRRDSNDSKRYAFQIWDLHTRTKVQQMDIPLSVFHGLYDEELNLYGKYLIYSDNVNKKNEMTNLETNETFQINYREPDEGLGTSVFLSPDGKIILYRPAYEGFTCLAESIELWDTSSQQNLYTFKVIVPDFGAHWCSGSVNIAFSPDNSLMAISHEEQVTLWEIH
jgi:WD40 repeat protein